MSRTHCSVFLLVDPVALHPFLCREPRRVGRVELPECILHDLLGDHVSVDPHLASLAFARDGARRVALRTALQEGTAAGP